jgi:serpin B
MDFIGAADAERARINAWVEAQTEQRIRNLLQPPHVTSATRLVLVNAVYFLGKWLHQFEGWATRDAIFHVPGNAASVPTMHQVESFRYAEDARVQVLEMPYEGGDLAMTIALPRARDGLPAVEAALDEATLGRWATALAARDVDVYLPRFEIRDAEIPLTEMLRAMGMSLAFDTTHADFTGIANGPTANERVAISAVVHRAFVKVDEEGTEAAAATAVAMVAGAAPPQNVEPPVVFRADHPFLFMIRDVRSGAVLFLGRMEDPR